MAKPQSTVRCADSAAPSTPLHSTPGRRDARWCTGWVWAATLGLALLVALAVDRQWGVNPQPRAATSLWAPWARRDPLLESPPPTPMDQALGLVHHVQEDVQRSAGQVGERMHTLKDWAKEELPSVPAHVAEGLRQLPDRAHEEYDKYLKHTVKSPSTDTLAMRQTEQEAEEAIRWRNSHVTGAIHASVAAVIINESHNGWPPVLVELGRRIRTLLDPQARATMASHASPRRLQGPTHSNPFLALALGLGICAAVVLYLVAQHLIRFYRSSPKPAGRRPAAENPRTPGRAGGAPPSPPRSPAKAPPDIGLFRHTLREGALVQVRPRPGQHSGLHGGTVQQVLPSRQLIILPTEGGAPVACSEQDLILVTPPPLADVIRAYDARRFGDALALCRRMLRPEAPLAPGLGPGLLLAGYCHVQVNQLREALLMFGRFADAWPANKEAAAQISDLTTRILAAHEERDFYTRLEVPPSATSEEITRSYKRIVLQYHPDRWGTATAAEQALASRIFAQIQHAADVLRDPRERERYDYGRLPKVV